MIDESTPFGARVAAHLRDDVVAWLTTVTPSGAPLPSPVWFLWDGARSVIVYSKPNTPRTRNIASNPKVSLNPDGDAQGGDIVVFSAEATVDESVPAAHESPAYLQKYSGQMARLGYEPLAFAAEYSVPVRLSLSKLRGH